ncbi:MAG: exo-alpha-sialidase [Lentisphaeria bacterium]|nr:exo-alpha-sialidase [Lentisphaeria bacterium]
MMKKFLALILLTTSAIIFAKDLLFNGGKLIPLESNIVETSSNHLCFCFAHRFSDGQIHFNHSKGVHTSSETTCTDISFDNGKTWKNNAGKEIFGINAGENSKKEKQYVSIWESFPKKIHNVTISKIDNNGKFSKRTQKIEFPYTTYCHTHRDILVLKNGTMLLTAYGRREGDKKIHAFIIRSTDDGESWHYHSILAEDKEGKTPEGPNEATLVELADGTIFGAWRDGGKLKYAYSNDEGKTWGETYTHDGFPMACSPHAILTSDNVLLLVSGRPNLYLLADFTGTGKNFQQYTIYEGSTSSYGSLIDMGNGEILLFHDESDFGAWRNDGPFNRIFADRYKIIKDPSIKTSSADPRSKNFNEFYSPATEMTPDETNLFVGWNYQQNKNIKNRIAFAEVVKIAERPYPILRITNHGDGKIVPSSQWALFRSKPLPKNIDKLEVEVEIRIQEPHLTSQQFYVNATLPDAENNCTRQASFTVGAKEVILNNQIKSTGNYDVGFHAFILKLDKESNKCSLYHKNSGKKLGETTLKQTPEKTETLVLFGDGSSATFGQVDLSYIGWKY